MVSSVFHAESRAIPQLVSRLWMNHFRLCYQDGGLNRGGHSWGTPHLGCPRDEQSERLLAGVAQPARVTVSENSLGSPCVRGTLSPSMITDLEVTNAPELSSGGPPSVPSLISVVLVEEAKAGGTPRRECPRDDHDIQSLAGVAKPASVTVYDDSLGSPCVGGMLSSSDIAGRLLPVVPVGMSFPVGPMDPAGPDGPFVAGGPAGPFGTMSPSDSDPARLAHMFQGAHMGRCLRLPLTMLARLAGMLLLALLGRLGRCPHLTVTLLARMLQGALLAQMGRYLRLSLTMLARLAGILLLALLARLGRCPHLTVTLLARMLQGALLAQMGRCPRLPLTMLAWLAGMLLLALLGRLGRCPCLPPVLRYWWTLVGVHSFRGREDRSFIQVF